MNAAGARPTVITVKYGVRAPSYCVLSVLSVPKCFITTYFTNERTRKSVKYTSKSKYLGIYLPYEVYAILFETFLPFFFHKSSSNILLYLAGINFSIQYTRKYIIFFDLNLCKNLIKLSLVLYTRSSIIIAILILSSLVYQYTMYTYILNMYVVFYLCKYKLTV